MRHHDAHGTTVDRLDVLTLERIRDDRLVGGDVGDRQVGRVAVLGVLDHVRRTRLDTRPVEQVAHSHAGPRRVELAPLRHAVDVERERDGLHLTQFVEADRERPIDETGDRQVPLAGRVGGHIAHVEHREAFGEVLTRRQSRRIDASGDEFLAVSIEESHSRSLPATGPGRTMHEPWLACGA